MSSSKPAPDFAIEVKDLNKIYRASGKMPEKHALKGLNLEIPRGSI
ncbi:MAG TPA: multidrug ABC transporter ATP-binding protein, partial [Hyphomonas sp.]|nr:multidrug ABC transporter ATP-binding protein [Hyphomonas sp.]